MLLRAAVDHRSRTLSPLPPVQGDPPTPQTVAGIPREAVLNSHAATKLGQDRHPIGFTSAFSSRHSNSARLFMIRWLQREGWDSRRTPGL